MIELYSTVRWDVHKVLIGELKIILRRLNFLKYFSVKSPWKAIGKQMETSI